MVGHKINVNTNVLEPTGNVDWHKYFIVLSPSLADATINENIAALQSIAIARGQEWTHITPTKNGICAGRTACLTLLKNYFPNTKYIRGLWLDADILIENPSKALDAINFADGYNLNIVANYPRGSVNAMDNTLYIKRIVDGVLRYDISITDEELDALPNFGKVDYAGLGFYYGYIPLDYTFHTDAVGEDFHFYEDNHIELRVAKEIKLAHQQLVWLRK